jgi:hypothetical protein
VMASKRCDGTNCLGHPLDCYGHPNECGCTRLGASNMGRRGAMMAPKATTKPLTNRETEELGNWLLQRCGREDSKTIAVRKALNDRDPRAALNLARGRGIPPAGPGDG